MSSSSISAGAKHQSHQEDFKKVEASRPLFENENVWNLTKPPKANWSPGDGANDDQWKKHKKIPIDVYAEGRPLVDNYKILISAITPRPVGFISSVDENGARNLAPFSYFNVFNFDPPIFVIGFATNALEQKDTCKNVLETGELTINIISEWFVEAANYASINAPYGVDEWKLTGLTPVESDLVKPPHVAESAFSVEAKLVTHHEWRSKANAEKTTGITCIVEGLKFHVRQDVVNEELNLIDMAKLKPVSRLGGISYGRTVDGFELLRPEYAEKSSEKS